jgi:hypothetical protein
MNTYMYMYYIHMTVYTDGLRVTGGMQVYGGTAYIYTYICIYVHIYIYTYIYMYMNIDK